MRCIIRKVSMNGLTISIFDERNNYAFAQSVNYTKKFLDCPVGVWIECNKLIPKKKQMG